MKKLCSFVLTSIFCIMSAAAQQSVAGDGGMTDGMIVRLSVIEVYPEYLDAYLEAAATVGGESVRTEPGVVCIFPSKINRDNCQIRILEIYRSTAAYESHIKTDHFQTYKQGTLHMVKSLDLVDMTPLDAAAMPLIFKKF